jgi:hypothetical protein
MQYGPLYNLNSYLTIKTSRISFKIFKGSITVAQKRALQDQ